MSVCSYRATISLRLQKHRRKTHKTGTLQWTDMVSHRRTSQDGKEQELSFTWQCSRNAWSSAWGWIMSQSKVYEWESRWQSNMGNAAVGVYCTLPAQVKQVAEAFFRQLEEVSCLKTLGLDICWKGKMVFKNHILQVPEHAGNKAKVAGGLRGWTSSF